jgi:flavin reductase (DIM6/NTAB) family NADH-FMN oxidoreductase RutF
VSAATGGATLSTVDLRSFMAGFPTGVAIVTSFDQENRPWGMTCTSLCSVSLAPPTILVCLRDSSPTLRALIERGVFSVNLLAHHAERAAVLFASGAADRFDRVSWTQPHLASGPYLLQDAHSIADCRVDDLKHVGDHLVVFAEVSRASTASAAVPLLYGRRSYTTWPSST